LRVRRQRAAVPDIGTARRVLEANQVRHERRGDALVAGSATAMGAAVVFKPARAIEPCIGDLKSERRMSRNHLAHAAGGAAANAVLAAAGYNFQRLLAWLAIFLRAWFAALVPAAKPPLNQNTAA